MAGFAESGNPPVVELVLSGQFSVLTKLSAGHFGLFWSELGANWTTPGDGPLIEDQFELFDRPKLFGKFMRLQPGRYPERFTLGHKDSDRLLQIQSTRFCFNWRKRDGFYPSYTKLIGEFDEMFAKFYDFVERKEIGPLILNQWEITYTDAFRKGEYDWNVPADWNRILPGLFGQLFSGDDIGLALEHRAAEWSYEIQPKRGRLHIAASPGRVKDDDTETLLLKTTARGPIGKSGVSTLREGLDLGHKVALAAFRRVVSAEVRKRWEMVS